MVQRVSTVSFEGVEVRPVDVQVQVAPGMPAFTVVGFARQGSLRSVGQVGRREIDGDAPRRQRQAGRDHGRAHALAPPMPEAKA
jgi:hypothetical protein